MDWLAPMCSHHQTSTQIQNPVPAYFQWPPHTGNVSQHIQGTLPAASRPPSKVARQGPTIPGLTEIPLTSSLLIFRGCVEAENSKINVSLQLYIQTVDQSQTATLDVDNYVYNDLTGLFTLLTSRSIQSTR